MSDLYLIGALPLWLIALVGLAAAALLAQQFINLPFSLYCALASMRD